MLDCALRYATRWSVFPCMPGEKRPACEHGCKDATRDETQIRAWWDATPTANIGVATGSSSGIFVVDVDGDEGLDALAGHAGRIPGTLTQQTPSGGYHFVFAYSVEVGNSARKLGPQLDTRGDGGYVVVAPSSTAKGAYRWLNRVAPAQIPGWLLRLVRPLPRREPDGPERDLGDAEGYAKAALEGECDKVAQAIQGSRNHTLNEAAFNLGTLVATGALHSETVYDALTQAAGQAGLGEREARRTIASGLTAGCKHPRTGAA